MSHISHSQVSMFTRCQEQWRRRYIDGERIPPGIAMAKGLAVHDAAKANFTQKIESRADMREDDIVEQAVESFRQRVVDGIVLTPAEQERSTDTVIGEAIDWTANIASLHATHQAPEYQPVLVEQQFDFPLPCGIELRGVIDLADEQRRVVDLKTTAKTPPANTADKSLQLTLYTIGHARLTGHLPSECRLDYLVALKRAPRHLVQITQRDRSDMEALSQRLDATIRQMNAITADPDMATGASLDSWCCDPRYCGYYSTCRMIPDRLKNKKGDEDE